MAVIPVKTGIQKWLISLDSRVRGNDENGSFLTFYEFVKTDRRRRTTTLGTSNLVCFSHLFLLFNQMEAILIVGVSHGNIRVKCRLFHSFIISNPQRSIVHYVVSPDPHIGPEINNIV